MIYCITVKIPATVSQTDKTICIEIPFTINVPLIIGTVTFFISCCGIADAGADAATYILVYLPSVCRRIANYNGDLLSYLRTFTSCGAARRPVAPRNELRKWREMLGRHSRGACATFRKCCCGGIT